MCQCMCAVYRFGIICYIIEPVDPILESYVDKSKFFSLVIVNTLI